MKPAEERYYKLSTYFKRISGGKKVHKVAIDAGLSCPNRDGKISFDGCIYCDNRGFSFNTRILPRPVEAQIEEGMSALRKRFGAEKFILYFQAHTNTYAPLDVLKQIYDKAKKFKDIIGISIATRPDCIDKRILDLIDSYTKDYEVWIEYGLQSIHNKTLELINRGHSYEDFLKAIGLTKERENIRISSHVIIGLPGETEKMIQETAREMGRLELDGIKIHPLHIIKATKLEKMHQQGLYQPLTLEEYADLATGFLGYLWPNTVIQRVSADCPKEFLVAPDWILDKNRVLQAIDEKLSKANTFQGRLYKEQEYPHSLSQRSFKSAN